jgi:hypothetical protein
MIMQMHRYLAITALAVGLVGCGGDLRPTTELTMVALNPWVGRAEFHIACGPAGGDVAHAPRLCQQIAERPDLITSPRPFVCAGGTSSWWDITITGRLNGRAIDHGVSTCWTPQMEMIGRLGLSSAVLHEHLVPRRRETVRPGTPRVFTSGLLRATDLVTCDILGHTLEIGVPVETGVTTSTGFGGNDVVTVTLKVARNRDGSVTASCQRGARGPTSHASHHA